MRIERLLSRNVTCLAVILLFCLLSFALPLVIGLPSGYDLVTDIRFASTLRDSLLSGQFFPGWANDNFGFGSIGIRFYPPFAFYLLALTEMITGDWFWAIWSNLVFWMVLGSVGIFLFVKEWGTPVQGLIAGIGYAIVPQHLSEVFQFFLFAEFAAWGVIPFCFLFLTRICRNSSWIDVVLFALSYSVLILTHLPTMIVISFCFPIYVLVVMEWSEFRTVFVQLATAIGLTVAATSFRWVIIVAEFNWVAHNDPKWSSGYYQYAAWLFPNTLTTRTQYIFVMSSWLFDIAILMSVALIIPALIYLFVTRQARGENSWRIIAASASVTAFAFFMLSKPSQFMWDAFPFLQKLQFPWRWMSALSFAAVVGFALSIPRLLTVFKGRERMVAYPATALIVAIILFNITQVIIPSEPIAFAKFSEVEKKVADEPMFEGWWPVWARAEALEIGDRVIARNRSVEISKWEPTDRTFTVGKGAPTHLRIATFYYPHWKAQVNNQPSEVTLDQDGAIAIPVDSEQSNVRLYFDEPTIVVIAQGLSFITWISFLVMVGLQVAKPALTERGSLPGLGYRAWLRKLDRRARHHS